MSNAIDEYYAWLDKENIRLMDELINTRKALDICDNELRRIQLDQTLKMEKAVRNIAKHAREQINEITKGGKDE